MQDFDYSVTTARTLEAAREERKRAFLEFVNNNRPDAHSAAPCDAEIVYDDNGDMKGIRFIGIKWSEKLGFDL